ncbi:MAG: aspartate/glutamate racemase family protein [Bacteroidota bacterium]
MKTIGLIGGMSWESSKLYYELLNRKVKAALGGWHSCKSILYTVDFDEIHHLQGEGNWVKLDQIMINAAQSLEKAGADIVLICANTMHLCSDAIKSNVSIPLLHIAEATGQAIVEKNIQKVALLGTKFTMEKDFYKTILTEQFGVEVLIPNAEERNFIHASIYDELVQGQIKETTRRQYQAIIQKMAKQGAEGVILGCTEIPLLIEQKDVTIPTFNTTKIHAEQAVSWALRENLITQ